MIRALRALLGFARIAFVCAPVAAQEPALEPATPSGAEIGAETSADDHADRTKVRAVRHWSYASYTRVVIELSGPVAVEKLERLAADSAAGRPERLYLDLPGVWVGHDWDTPEPVEDGLLAAIRLGQFESDAARAVIDLARYARHRVFSLSGPDRIVVDVFGPRGPQETPGDALAELGLPTDPLPDVAARGPSRVPPRKLLVVLDPGHGGDDPGTQGPRGLQEKHITLAVARSARERLLARGFEVLLTREKDRTLSLEERTALAEGASGDVFVSIHVNAAPRSRVRGIETYYLDANHERHALRVAARESGVAPSQLDELQRALAGFKISEISTRSELLANSVHHEVVGGVRETYGSVDDLGVKRGPFHVLFLSNVPAVLVEIGFLSNPTEASRLRTRLYQDVIAEQIARGLSRFRQARPDQLAGSWR